MKYIDLSKCWNIIQRMSEDIDIAIDWEFLGFGGQLSRTQISGRSMSAPVENVPIRY